MNNNLTVVMYHYVREIHNSKYPNIRGIELEGFKRQLDFLQSKFSIISQQPGNAKHGNDTMLKCVLFDGGTIGNV